MTDRAAELREALDRLDRTDKRPAIYTDDQFVIDTVLVIDAARTIALPILEGDEGLVERIAIGLLAFYLVDPSKAGRIWEGSGSDYQAQYLAQARAVLAALIPTEGEGE